MKNSIKDEHNCNVDVRNTDTKRLSNLAVLTDEHLELLDDSDVTYRVLRRVSTLMQAGKHAVTGTMYYNIAVNHVQYPKVMALIDSVNKMKTGPVEAYFEGL